MQAHVVLVPSTYLPADFVDALSRVNSARYVQRFVQGIEALCALGNGGFLNKTGCKDARQAITGVLNDTVRALWERHMDLVRAHHTGPLSDLYYTSIDSAPMLASWLKRASAVAGGFSGTRYMELVAELAQLVRWFTPISQQLLCKDVLSRAGSGVDPAVKQQQAEVRRAKIAARGTIYKTCPCCYNEQAIGSAGRMVHHGYSRPGHGYQTASCYGFSMLPLEVSPEGVQHVAQLLQEQLERTVAALLAAPRLRALLIENPKHRPWVKGDKEPRTITIDPSHPDWKTRHAGHVARLNVERQSLQRDIAERKAVIAAWHVGMTQHEALSVGNAVRHTETA